LGFTNSFPSGPCSVTDLTRTVDVVAEDYDEERAVVHVRRLLDIVACTTSFGPSATSKESLKSDAPKNALGAQDKGAPASTKKSTTVNTKAQGTAAKQEATMEEEGEMSHAFPKLGTFYEFFSLSHLTPPLQCTLLSLSLSLSLCMCVYASLQFLETVGKEVKGK
jgi:hypothetical protein